MAKSGKVPGSSLWSQENQMQKGRREDVVVTGAPTHSPTRLTTWETGPIVTRPTAGLATVCGAVVGFGSKSPGRPFLTRPLGSILTAVAIVGFDSTAGTRKATKVNLSSVWPSFFSEEPSSFGHCSAPHQLHCIAYRLHSAIMPTRHDALALQNTASATRLLFSARCLFFFCTARSHFLSGPCRAGTAICRFSSPSHCQL